MDIQIYKNIDQHRPLTTDLQVGYTHLHHFNMFEVLVVIMSHKPLSRFLAHSLIRTVRWGRRGR